MMSDAFYKQGHFCAAHPWEVIVGMLTMTICLISMGGMLTDADHIVNWTDGDRVGIETRGLDYIVMTAMKCVALLYIYHQFRKLWKLGSHYVLGIAGLFAVFSSLIFSGSVINFLKIDFAELNEAWPFFLLLIDLSKASLLAQWALSSSCQKEVRENIARGMALLGPTLTLDTLVETLVIGVGTLSGVKRLELICRFACTSVVVNYFVFMSFYPACLSLVLELSKEQDGSRPVWQLTSLTRALQDEERKPNPVIQRVKLIMSAGLVLVHAHSRWPIFINSREMAIERNPGLSLMDDAITESNKYADQFNRWVSGSADQVVMLILAIVLSIKYMFFENKDSLPEPYLVPVVAMSGKDEPQRVIRQESVATHESCLKCDLKQESKAVQVDDLPKEYELSKVTVTKEKKQIINSLPPRPIDQCLDILKFQKTPEDLSDEEVMQLVEARHILAYRLEWELNDPERGVQIRRNLIKKKSGQDAFESLPYTNYDYSLVMGACCENVVGYVPVPVGIVGPLVVNGKTYYVPLATTEGCLVASTNRGCRAISTGEGVSCTITKNGMTRAPCVGFSSAKRAAEVMAWLNEPQNFQVVKDRFDSSSRFARLESLETRITARFLYIRFRASTGDAMGMNMLSKGSEIALKYLRTIFEDMEIVSLSGNVCTDKKPSAVNWIEGRGKSVVCEAEIPEKVVREVLKTSVKALVEKNHIKNHIGSAVAGSIGGFNAQAANIVTAVFIATGQDPAQNVTSSNCITVMEPSKKGLYVSVTMPCMEVGTIGGGTILPPQGACLDLMGVRGPCLEKPGQNAATLAQIVCATVLAGELSLMSALASGDLVRSHLTHNRSQTSVEGSPAHRVGSSDSTAAS